MASLDASERIAVFATTITDVLNFADDFKANYADDPQPGSQAEQEMLSNAEAGPSGAWGHFPVRLAYWIAGSDLALATTSYLDSLRQLLQPEMSLFGFQVVTRALVESAARSWWILAPEIEARQRVARAWVERWESLRELVRAAKAANQSVEGQVLGFRAEAAALGLSEDYDAKHRLKGFEGITRPGPTSLVPQFLSACGLRQGEMLYRFYSGVAHSALYGIHQYRQYHPTDDGKALRASANLTTQAVANAAVLGITAFLASGEAFAYLYGRDVEQVRLMRFQSAGRILTVEFGTSEI